MNFCKIAKSFLLLILLLLISLSASAEVDNYQLARQYQRNKDFDNAIQAYKNHLLAPAGDCELAPDEIKAYTDALVQLMNSFQSAGRPEACVEMLREIYLASPILQSQCLRDYYSVLGYALSRTECMNEAEWAVLKALSLPLQSATPERYFRDYAYAAAVFYSNLDYNDQVLNWCNKAIEQAELSDNPSGVQWVTVMLGSLYKRNGDLHQAMTLFQKSRDEAKARKDDLGELNSLHSMVDLFLYWDIPEYADIYATEAISLHEHISGINPMVSAQSYINKARTVHVLGHLDSILFYSDKARVLCESLPYNSGMVDVDLLSGIYLTESGGDSFQEGVHLLKNVVSQGTPANQAKAYHQLAIVYLRNGNGAIAEQMLDSLYAIFDGMGRHILHLDYEPIIDHYLKTGNQTKAQRYTKLLLNEHEEFMHNKVNEKLVDAIVHFQAEQVIHELEMSRLELNNQRLLLLAVSTFSLFVILVAFLLMFKQKRRHNSKIKEADIKLDALVRKINESNLQNEIRAQEIREFLGDREKRTALEAIAPHILQEGDEVKFRQCFELLHPLFLNRLREKVPGVSRREELLSMLVVLKRDNKEIAEFLAVAPRSVLMLRHRFRQKIGLSSDNSLENFIEAVLDDQARS